MHLHYMRCHGYYSALNYGQWLCASIYACMCWPYSICSMDATFINRINVEHYVIISKSLYAVKVRRHKPWSRGPLSWIPGMWFTLCQFHSRWHSLRITLKSTTLLFMRSSNAWTTKPWQRSEWRLGFNSVLFLLNGSVQK